MVVARIRNGRASATLARSRIERASGASRVPQGPEGLSMRRVVRDLHLRCSRRVCGENEPEFRGPGEQATAVAMVRVMATRTVFVGILLAFTALPLGAGEPIRMKVSPAVAFAPANLIVRATIEADAANRAVEIIAESTDFYRSSEIQLQGEKAARTNTFEFRSLPPGTYEVRAT